ncbi:MAG: cell division protein ZapA [Bacteroidales bacterium]|nr:cell division protein ZapA [Bacteroidales bacterium]
MEQQNISIKIAGKEFPLTIDRDDEEVVRMAAERIGEMVAEVTDRYENVDMCDVLSVILLGEEKKLIDLQRRYNGDSEGVFQQLKDLDIQLEEYLLSR